MNLFVTISITICVTLITVFLLQTLVVGYYVKRSRFATPDDNDEYLKLLVEKRQHLSAMTNAIIPVLNKHKVQYCCIFGTLLGLARSESIIPHDDDVDFLVKESSWTNKRLVVMDEIGTQFHVSTLLPGIVKFCSHKFPDVCVDLILTKLDNRIYSLRGTLTSYHFTAEEIGQPSMYTFPLFSPFPVALPENTLALLYRIYGQGCLSLICSRPPHSSLDIFSDKICGLVNVDGTPNDHFSNRNRIGVAAWRKDQ